MKLNDPRLFRQYAYIGGKWTHGDGGREEAVIDPATEETLGHIPLLEPNQIREAVEAADQAFVHWRSLRADERCERLLAWYDLLQANREDLATIMTLEQGKPLPDARGEVEYGASFVRWFAEEGKRTFGQTIPSHIPNAALGTIKEPVGVAALITPWNFPLAMITRKAAAAMAAGCTVVLKPSELSPLSALAFAQAVHEAGFPAGVFNLVNGDGAVVGTALSEHSDVDMISITGSTRAGILVAQAAAKTVKRVAQELGGKSPNLLLPDADFNTAVPAGIAAGMRNCGQSCSAPTRMLVPNSRMDEVAAIAQAAAAKVKTGDPKAADTVMGPVVSKAQWTKIQDLITAGIEEGAKVIAGGPGRPEAGLLGNEWKNS